MVHEGRADDEARSRPSRILKEPRTFLRDGEDQYQDWMHLEGGTKAIGDLPQM